MKAEAAGNLMVFMKTVTAAAAEHAGDKIKSYGFNADTMGIMQFVNAVKIHAAASPEIDAGVKKVSAMVMPGGN